MKICILWSAWKTAIDRKSFGVKGFDQFLYFCQDCIKDWSEFLFAYRWSQMSEFNSSWWWWWGGKRFSGPKENY